MKWTVKQHRLVRQNARHFRRVGARVCDNFDCQLMYTYGDHADDYIFEDTFAHSGTVLLQFENQNLLALC